MSRKDSRQTGMFAKGFTRICRSKQGMTLVEVLCSLAILSLVFLVMAGGFSTAARLFNRSTDVKNSGQLTAGELERISTPATSDDQSSIQVGDVTIKGTLNSYHQASGDEVMFYVFAPAGFDLDAPKQTE